MRSSISYRHDNVLLFCMFMALCSLFPLPASAENEEAEHNYQEFLTIYRQDTSTQAQLQNALTLLQTANQLAPDTYKYVFSLGALNNTLGHWEDATRWLEQAKTLASTEQQKQSIQNELAYCQTQLAKLKISSWSDPGVSVSFIMKEGTAEMDRATIAKLPAQLPVVKVGDSPAPLEEAIRHKLQGMKINIAVKDVFVVVSLEDNTPAEIHYQKGIRDFYQYFKNQYFTQPPQRWLVVLIAPRPYPLVEATKRLYPQMGIPVYAPFLGYYNPADNLIMATGGTSGYGTVLHEMIHAMMQADFPQAPPWLNEGLASLYERTQWHSNRLNALPNWRMDRMRQQDVPSLQMLTTQASQIGLHSADIAGIRLLLLLLDQRQQVDDLYRMVKQQGASFSLPQAVSQLGLKEADWQAFLTETFRDYRAEQYRGRGALSNPDEIRFVQQALGQVLKADIKPDGIWGPSSQALLEEFQRRFHLTPDGIPGPHTLRELKRQYTLGQVKAL